MGILPKTAVLLDQVVFKAVHVHGTNTTVKIDDFSVRDGACSPLGSCDFESGQCTWVNILQEDGHDWVLARGGFHGPPTDHTTQTPEGMALNKDYWVKVLATKMWYTGEKKLDKPTVLFDAFG